MDIKENKMSGLDGNAIIDEVVKLTTSLRSDVTNYMQTLQENFKTTISKIDAGDEARFEHFNAAKNELEAKFKHYMEEIQTSLIEYDLKNAKRVEDALNSNRLIAASTIFASENFSTRESSVDTVFFLERLISERNDKETSRKL